MYLTFDVRRPQHAAVLDRPDLFDFFEASQNSAIRDAESRLLPDIQPDLQVERWCNQVAAELLVPLETFHNEYQQN